MREVKRSFGNKVTWETPFEDHYKKFAEELNSYVYNSNKKCIAIKKDVIDIDSNNNYDLVYIDPPYIPARGENIIYRDLYHFLEGITIYNSWESLIDNNSKHKRLIPEYNPWNDKKAVFNVFEKLIGKFKDSIILISHRSEGLPSINELIKILKKYKKEVECVDIIYHKYALSTKKSEEVLLMGI
jgi:adenine-specific DNA methylase